MAAAAAGGGGGKFGIKINPELILKLTEPEPAPEKSLPPSPFFPKQPRKKTPPKPKTAEVKKEVSEAEKPLPRADPKQTLTIPLPPQTLIHAPPPPPPPAADEEDAALLPLKKTVAECEQILEKLKSKESEERVLMQERAKELMLKTEYQAPRPKPLPCFDQKKNCIECLNTNRNDPLKCQDSVKAYALCAQQLQHGLLSSSGFGPKTQVNS